MSDWTEAEYKAILTHKPQDPATKKITTIETNEISKNTNENKLKTIRHEQQVVEYYHNNVKQ